MKGGWETKRLEDVAAVSAGNPAPQDKALFDGGTHPFFRTSDVGRVRLGRLSDSEDHLNAKGIRKLKLHKAGTILLPKSGASTYLDHRVIMDVDGYVSSHLATVFPKPNIVDRQFLFYALLTISARELSADSSYPTLSLKQVQDIEVRVPPLDEQRRIVAVLDKAFAGIATATASAQKNLTNARALFESSLHSIFTNQGESWNERPLGEVCKFVGGSQPPKAVFSPTPSDKHIRLIQIRDYKSDKHVVYIPKTLARRFCAKDDVMIGRYGPPLFQILRGIDGAYNVALMKAVPDETRISKDYLFYFLRNRDLLSYIIGASARAAGQIGLTKETIEPYPIPFPSLERQAEIVNRLMNVEADTKRLEIVVQKKLTALTELKQSLLHKAFAGELT